MTFAASNELSVHDTVDKLLQKRPQMYHTVCLFCKWSFKFGLSCKVTDFISGTDVREGLGISETLTSTIRNAADDVMR